MGDGRMLFSFYLISYYIIRQSGGLAYEALLYDGADIPHTCLPRVTHSWVVSAPHSWVPRGTHEWVARGGYPWRGKTLHEIMLWDD